MYPPAGPYQPVYPGQIPGTWQPGSSTPLSATPYPGYAPYAGHPGYGAYPTYPGYNTYPGYGAYPGYAGYVQHPWPAPPVRPKRDGYTLAVAITAFAGSCLAILSGLLFLVFIALIGIGQSFSRAPMPNDTLFPAIMFLLTFAIVGLVGGGFGMYHSIRALFLRKPSKHIWLPRFWILLLCYLATLGIGFWLYAQGQQITSLPLTGLLVYLAGLFPALTVLALGMRCLSFPLFKNGRLKGQYRSREQRAAVWPTSWRRMVLAVLSGATLSITLAFVLELLFLLILIGSEGLNFFQYAQLNTNNPSPSQYTLLLITAAIVAPLVEEMVKPLAVVVLIGRVKSKTEAFALGLACGIGFNLVETSGYISQGYGDWLNVAIGRSGAGLLHGFGAAMVALGWYILTHKEEGVWQKRTLIALGCIGYAVLQHALWNGVGALVLIPGPIGTFFSTWSWTAGPVSIDGPELVNIVETVGILIFFILMSILLRHRETKSISQTRDAQPLASGSIAPA